MVTSERIPVQNTGTHNELYVTHFDVFDSVVLIYGIKLVRMEAALASGDRERMVSPSSHIKVVSWFVVPLFPCGMGSTTLH